MAYGRRQYMIVWTDSRCFQHLRRIVLWSWKARQRLVFVNPLQSAYWMWQTYCFPFLDFGECHRPAFITHKQAGTAFQRISGARRRPTQDMPRINHSCYGDKAVSAEVPPTGRPWHPSRLRSSYLITTFQQHFCPPCIPSINAHNKSPISMGELFWCCVHPLWASLCASY